MVGLGARYSPLIVRIPLLPRVAPEGSIELRLGGGKDSPAAYKPAYELDHPEPVS